MVLQQVFVQLQHWLGEHTHGQVNQAQLGCGEPLAHAPIQVPRQCHIVLAVDTVVNQLFFAEVFAEVIDVLLDLFALDSKAVVSGQHR